MTDWELAQDHLAKRLGGKVTPGSGNGRLKGDVICDDLIFEVKQTSKTKISIQRRWFNKLLKEANGKHPAFAIYFKLVPYIYVLETEVHTEDIEWKSKVLDEANLPDVIYTQRNQLWRLTPLTHLRN